MKNILHIWYFSPISPVEFDVFCSLLFFCLADDSSRPQSPAPKKQAMVELYDDLADDQDHEKEELLQAETSKKRVGVVTIYV